MVRRIMESLVMRDDVLNTVEEGRCLWKGRWNRFKSFITEFNRMAIR